MQHHAIHFNSERGISKVDRPKGFEPPPTFTTEQVHGGSSYNKWIFNCNKGLGGSIRLTRAPQSIATATATDKQRKISAVQDEQVVRSETRRMKKSSIQCPPPPIRRQMLPVLMAVGDKSEVWGAKGHPGQKLPVLHLL